MLAAILTAPAPVSTKPLRIQEVTGPVRGANHVLLRVRACGVCRTDLHVIEGELPPLRPEIIPGHQIVGEVVEGPLPAGARVGVSWLGGTDGSCPYCRRGAENLCDAPVFTGYSIDGGYAEFAVARADFTVPIPHGMSDLEAAPLLCAGIIGFRSLRVAGVQPGDNVGLFCF
jgi:propanol-preferring alcohol dehydrogenase